MTYEDLGTRAEHLAWCKQRALEYVDMNQPGQAWTSFMSDMNKHSGTRGHTCLMLGGQMLIAGHFKDPNVLRKFINDFN